MVKEEDSATKNAMERGERRGQGDQKMLWKEVVKEEDRVTKNAMERGGERRGQGDKKCYGKRW